MLRDSIQPCGHAEGNRQIRICRRIGKTQLGIYLISLSCTSDQLDIFHCALLKQKYFDKKALQVVGIAEGREEAIFLVQQMLQDTVDAGMEADIKGYLQKTFTSGKGGGG